jgi:hypothetical protein
MFTLAFIGIVRLLVLVCCAQISERFRLFRRVLCCCASSSNKQTLNLLCPTVTCLLPVSCFPEDCERGIGELVSSNELEVIAKLEIPHAVRCEWNFTVLQAHHNTDFWLATGLSILRLCLVMSERQINQGKLRNCVEVGLAKKNFWSFWNFNYSYWVAFACCCWL